MDKFTYFIRAQAEMYGRARPINTTYSVSYMINSDEDFHDFHDFIIEDLESRGYKYVFLESISLVGFPMPQCYLESQSQMSKRAVA